MSELSIAYTNDGEWLNIATNPDYEGMLIKIEPETNDIQHSLHPVVIRSKEDFTDAQGRVWTPTASAQGQFAIGAPYRRRLEDWRLELRGLPRMYEKLEMDVIKALFGISVTEQLQRLYKHLLPHRESIGDLRAQHRVRGHLTMDEAANAMKRFTVAVDENINSLTLTKRREFLATAVEDSGRLIVARSVLIRP